MTTVTDIAPRRPPSRLVRVLALDEVRSARRAQHQLSRDAADRGDLCAGSRALFAGRAGRLETAAAAEHRTLARH